MTANYIDPDHDETEGDVRSLIDRAGFDHGMSETAGRLARRPWPTDRLRLDVELSFEYFPAGGATAAESLDDCARRLDELGPSYVSVTYGAGGTSQDRTFDTVERLQRIVGSPVAGHLTTVGATRARTLAVVDRYLELGVRHIVALRGDPPTDPAERRRAEECTGFPTAVDLVAAVRARAADRTDDPVTISVAGYPEVHPRAASAQADMENLVAKVEAGADRIITQFFYDNANYLEFLQRYREAGITVPIVTGIMPVVSFNRVSGFAERCGARIPPWMHDLFRGLDDAPDVHQLVSATLAAEQCRELAEHGVRRFHFYTMNRPELTLSTCRSLGFGAATPRRETVGSVRAS